MHTSLCPAEEPAGPGGRSDDETTERINRHAWDHMDASPEVTGLAGYAERGEPHHH